MFPKFNGNYCEVVFIMIVLNKSNEKILEKSRNNLFIMQLDLCMLNIDFIFFEYEDRFGTSKLWNLISRSDPLCHFV